MTDPKKPECRKLVAVTFVNAVSWSAQHVAVGQTCESIAPARLLPDGDWAVIDNNQRADGVGIVRMQGPNTARELKRHFIPWANVADLAYGNEKAAK